MTLLPAENLAGTPGALWVAPLLKLQSHGDCAAVIGMRRRHAERAGYNRAAAAMRSAR